MKSGTLGGAVSLKYNTSTGALVYSGTSAQTTSSIEFPISNRPFYVTINNPAGVTLNSNKTTMGDLTISSGTLADGGFTFTVNRNNINNSIHSGSGKIYLNNGTASHTLSGTGTYGNLELNDPLGATLSANTLINGTLTLTGGTLTNGSYLTLGNSASIIKVGGSLSATPTFGTAVNLTLGKSNSSGCSITTGLNQLTMGTIYPPGFLITSPELPANTTILSTSGSIATLSNNATLTATSVSMTITWPNVITTGVELPSSSSVLGNLVINNAAGAALSASTTVNGTLTLTSGALAVGANTLSLNGPAIAGTPANLSTTSSSSLSFGGSSSSVVLPSSVANLNNLTVNNASGVTLSAPLTVTGTLTVTSGDLNTNGNLVTLGTSATLSETATNIVTGTITTTRTVAQNAANTFGGIGVEITDADNVLGSTAVTRVTGTASTGTSNSSIKRYYTITPTNNSNLNATLVFHYNDRTDELNGISEANLKLWKSTDSRNTWVVGGIGTVDVALNTVTMTGLLDFSDWTLGDANAPLPVELSSFSASINKRNVSLNWKTATEVNFNSFEIERMQLNSENNWQKIALVQASGNSNSPKNYAYTDSKLTSGKFQYRLKMVDNDGSYKYSQTVEVSIETPKTFELAQNFPNPFNPSTIISYGLPKESNVLLEVYSLTGQHLRTLVSGHQAAGSYEVSFDASNLSAGIYIYQLKSDGLVLTNKMLLVK